MNPLTPSNRDWPEDATHENGNYLNQCQSCKETFIGHKRRYTCKKCASEEKARWEALTPDEQEAEKTRIANEVAEWCYRNVPLDRVAGK